MMECLATELQDRNIGASVLVPGPTMTNLGKSSFENRPAESQKRGRNMAAQNASAPERRSAPAAARGHEGCNHGPGGDRRACDAGYQE